MPKLSVIIPVYNAKDYLRECLDSIINQSFKDIEIICVDDGSTDNSLEILQEYAQNDNRIKIVQQKNQYAGVARNNGMKVASGEYLHFMDSDDYLADEFVYEKMLEIACANSSQNIIRFKAEAFDSKTKQHIIKLNYEQKEIKKEILNSVIDIDNHLDWILKLSVVPWVGIIKRDFVLENNLEFNNNRCSNDLSFFILSLITAKSLFLSDLCVVKHRINNSNSLIGVRENYFDCLFNSVNIVVDFVKKSELSQEAKTQIILHSYSDLFGWYRRYIYKSKKSYEIFKNTVNFIKQVDIDELEPQLKEKSFCKLMCKMHNRSVFYLQICYFMDKFLFDFKKFIKNIFSITNLKDVSGEKFKLITICGFKFKKSQVKKISVNQRENSVLLVEPNNCHGEVLTGVAKYFIDLGYNVDVILSKYNFENKIFARFESDKIRFYVSDLWSIFYFLKNEKNIAKYKYIYMNSDMIYSLAKPVYEVFEEVSFASKHVQMCHRLEVSEKKADKKIKLLSLDNFQDNFTMVNSHYFGEVQITPKNEQTNFIIVGNISSKRKNYDLLNNAIKYLLNKGLNNFKITVVAKTGNLDNLSEECKSHVDFKGALKYSEMYDEMEKSDFFLTLLDPENLEHDRYLTQGTSGSFQLIYGFRKPCLIEDKFASKYRFNNENSIVYSGNNNLGIAMEQAILMNNEEYSLKQEKLSEVADKLYEESLKNLKEILG